MFGAPGEVHHPTLRFFVAQEAQSTQLNVNLRTQVKHLIVRIYLSKLNIKLYVTYYSY